MGHEQDGLDEATLFGQQLWLDALRDSNGDEALAAQRIEGILKSRADLIAAGAIISPTVFEDGISAGVQLSLLT